MSPNHGTAVRWFTWQGRDKYIWEIEVGSETNLSAVVATGAWDPANRTASISGGVLRATRTYCGRDSKPEGCKPARNDGAAFSEIEFVTSLQ